MGSAQLVCVEGGPPMKIDAVMIPALKDCVHCGLCLPECPTYHATGREAESPRGRIAALRGVVEERSSVSDAIHDGLESCLVCRACESACPSGISMENLMARYREQTRNVRGDFSASLESWLLSYVISHPRRLNACLNLVRILSPGLRIFPGNEDLPARHRLRPQPPVPQLLEPSGQARGTVSILRGCVADRLFREETHLAARLLARAGWRVLVPAAGCCGALHHHAGLVEAGQRHASLRWKDLSAAEVDFVVVDSAGCGSHLLGQRDSDSPPITDTATLLANEGGFVAQSRLPGRWAISVPCHQQHSDLDSTTGISIIESCVEERVELPAQDHCCGAAGMYLLRRRKLSRKIGKMAHERFEKSDADAIVSGNPGCLLRWEGLLGSSRAKHPVQILAQSSGLTPI